MTAATFAVRRRARAAAGCRQRLAAGWGTLGLASLLATSAPARADHQARLTPAIHGHPASWVFANSAAEHLRPTVGLRGGGPFNFVDTWSFDLDTDARVNEVSVVMNAGRHGTPRPGAGLATLELRILDPSGQALVAWLPAFGLGGPEHVLSVAPPRGGLFESGRYVLEVRGLILDPQAASYSGVLSTSAPTVLSAQGAALMVLSLLLVALIRTRGLATT